MPRRCTPKQLEHEVTRINGLLAEMGVDTRVESHGRNGYQAVDEYSVDTHGNRIGSGVNRNVCCGTSRECGDAIDHYYAAKRIAVLEAKLSEVVDE